MSQETAMNEITERIEEIHELSFAILEEKKDGATVVPIEDYEKLLNYIIEYMQDIRDAVDEHGNKVFCGKCSTEVKGGGNNGQ